MIFRTTSVPPISSLGVVLSLFFLAQTRLIMVASAFLLPSPSTFRPNQSLHNAIRISIATRVQKDHASIRCDQKTRLCVSSGFTFFDGDQFLVSAQKPLGIVLEEDDTTGYKSVIEVVEGYSAAQVGIQVGDVLVAVQNADCLTKSLDETLAFLGDCPRVVNLRFARPSEPEK